MDSAQPRRWPRLSLRRKPMDELLAGQPYVRERGGVEAVLLSMPEIGGAIETIYLHARHDGADLPGRGYLEAATLAMRAELGLSASKMRKRQRGMLGVMKEHYERGQVGVLLRLYEDQRAVTAAGDRK